MLNQRGLADRTDIGHQPVFFNAFCRMLSGLNRYETKRIVMDKNRILSCDRYNMDLSMIGKRRFEPVIDTLARANSAVI